MKKEILAWRKYPEPKGENYFKQDLQYRFKVIELFDYCQILEAVIFNKGWEFLFETYGLKEIIKIDKESSWFDYEDIGETIKSIYYDSFISGFEPKRMKYGKYIVDKDVFIYDDGKEEKIDWLEIYNQKNSD